MGVSSLWPLVTVLLVIIVAAQAWALRRQLRD
jgi:hypothetical protein